ncbi:hypothetical protein BS50DRAFT_579700 [Corynespora cassiicola Philippines]|uniref:Uncharacterized protein n=1 Tax=Corynespora cassiicola Philippines TaxID=1448308 RepID=A0A2T2N4F0_CORCC|nr:hypothetical protein BS50DRAFT_579700 [Corynespora cassiicola Philippines]
MKPASIILAAFSAVTFASPSSLEARATACQKGSTYCGWYLIDQLGWSASTLRSALCSHIGACDGNSGDAWNSLFTCEGDWQIRAKRVCGGTNSCAGPAAHCV